jgi:hypothetical protein
MPTKAYGDLDPAILPILQRSKITGVRYTNLDANCQTAQIPR